MFGFFGRYRLWRAGRRARWEAICDRCGLCCYQKQYRRGRFIIDLSDPCRYLDGETRNCTVYPERFKVCLQCRKVTMYHALFSRLMPAECAYVKRYRKWGFLIPSPKIQDPGEPQRQE